jgi:hypothetical protein
VSDTLREINLLYPIRSRNLTITPLAKNRKTSEEKKKENNKRRT